MTILNYKEPAIHMVALKKQLPNWLLLNLLRDNNFFLSGFLVAKGGQQLLPSKYLVNTSTLNWCFCSN